MTEFIIVPSTDIILVLFPNYEDDLLDLIHLFHFVIVHDLCHFLSATLFCFNLFRFTALSVTIHFKRHRFPFNIIIIFP